MSSLVLRYLAYLGPNKEPASVDLAPGLNVICGASETGKSFIAESIDFMLGGQDAPTDIPERGGYDRVRLMLESSGWPPLTLERSVEGGHFAAYHEALRDDSPQTDRFVLREKHQKVRQDTLSHALLERLGLSGKRVRRNRAGETRTLSIRDLIRLSVVTEGEIQRRGSPFLSGQWVTATPEYAALKFLLTGTDDSALVAGDESTASENAVSGKLELLDEMIEELRSEIQEEGLDESELEEQLEKLTKSIDEQTNALETVQGNFNELLDKRSRAAKQLQELRARKIEINELIGRFGLLEEQYVTDLHRLEAVRESGSLFVHLERESCPLCGAVPGEQHLEDDCDGNTEQVVLAASAEMQKTGRLQAELHDTVASLRREYDQIDHEWLEYEAAYNEADLEIDEVAKPAVLNERASYQELVSKRADITSAKEKFARLSRLSFQKDELEIVESESGGQTDTRTQIPTRTLDRFSSLVEGILRDWGFPGAAGVFFDESKKDFQIAGRDRGSTGQGLRAISHAAVSIGLLEFCLENDLPHPGFVVLDSPLLAYWKPEGEEDDLSGTDLKERFYTYLMGLRAHAQMVIIENEHPPEFVEEDANVIVFTKNPHEGRYGFFPITELPA